MKNSKLDYKGWTLLQDEPMAAFFSGDYKSCNLIENEYVLAGKQIYKYQDETAKLIEYPTIDTKFGGCVKPKEHYQAAAMDLLKDPSITVKLIRGVYGSGKDYLMMNQALESIENGDFEKIIFIRPNITLAGLPDIGALPGDADEKLNWTLAPLYDKVGGQEGIDRLIREDKLEMVPLLFVRGRSFENSIVYVTEAQNITAEIAKVLISRIGEGSELWLNGDFHQTDKRLFEQDNGLATMVDRLSGNRLFGTIYLPESHRSATAKLADLLDN